MSLHLGPCRKRSPTEHVNGAAFRQLNARIPPEDVAREVQLSLVPGDAVQLNQTHFDFRMPRYDGLSRGGSVIGNEEVVDKADSGIQQPAIPGCPIVCNRALEHVPDVVQLVPRRLGLRKHSQRLAIILVVGVQIPAGFLDGYDLVDDFLRRFPERRAVARLQYKSNRLGPLVNIGIGKYGARLRRLTLSQQTAEVVHPPVGFQQVMHRWNAPAHIDLAAWSPETARDGYGTHWNVPELGVGRFCEIFDSLILPLRRVNKVAVALRQPCSIRPASSKRADRKRRCGSDRNRRSDELSTRDIAFFIHDPAPL